MAAMETKLDLLNAKIDALNARMPSQPMMPQFAPGGGFPGAPGPFTPALQPMQPAMGPGQGQPRPQMSSMFGASAPQAVMQATQSGTGVWYSIAGGPTDRPYGMAIFEGSRAALGLSVLSCLAQLVTYIYLAVEASGRVNICKSFASMGSLFGRHGGDCSDSKKSMVNATMALSIIAGIIYSIGFFAFAFFAVTQQYNKTKTRARQQWLAQSGVMIIGALSSFIATILYVAAHNGTWALHLVPDQPPEI